MSTTTATVHAIKTLLVVAAAHVIVTRPVASTVQVVGAVIVVVAVAAHVAGGVMVAVAVQAAVQVVGARLSEDIAQGTRSLLYNPVKVAGAAQVRLGALCIAATAEVLIVPLDMIRDGVVGEAQVT